MKFQIKFAYSGFVTEARPGLSRKQAVERCITARLMGFRCWIVPTIAVAKRIQHVQV